MTYREWPLVCGSCQHTWSRWAWNTDLPLPCPACGARSCAPEETPREAHGVVPDSIPGGLLIQNGLVDAAGRPRRFYSRTDIKRACNEYGLTWMHDTPKPYKVAWSGVRKRRFDERFDRHD